jgi:hypothetical protein
VSVFEGEMGSSWRKLTGQYTCRLDGDTIGGLSMLWNALRLGGRTFMFRCALGLLTLMFW